jgi:hypothetical protein
MALGRAAKVTADGKFTPDAVAAQMAKGKIDAFLNNITPQQVATGNPQAAVNILRNANADYGAAARAGGVDRLLENARIDAAKVGSGLGKMNKVRQALAPLMKNDFLKTSNYTPAEKSLLEQQVMGTPLRNAVRYGSNVFAGGGGIASHGVGAITGSIGAALGGPMGAAAGYLLGPGVGHGLRLIANSQATKGAQELSKVLLERSPTFAAANGQRQSAISIIKAAKAQKAAEALRAATVGTLPRIYVGPKRDGKD